MISPLPNRTHAARRGAFTLLLAILFLAPALRTAAEDDPTVTYRRVFKGSVPEFIEIKIPQHGMCSFEIRQLDDDPGAEPFDVGAPIRDKIFELAAALNHFVVPSLDVQKQHIANLGQKTFRYENGADAHETTFNYTLDPNATQLQALFDGLARQQEDLMAIQRAAKYDRLGVNDALRQFDSDLSRRALPEPEHFLSVLDQIAMDSRYVEIARTLARSLAERIRDSHGQ